MYARYFRNADRKIYLYNTNTHELRRVASTSGRRWILRSSQVSGNYAVWEKSEVRRGHLAGCNVFLYDIAGDTTTKLDNPNARCQYSPAVNPAGTVFFARSGFGCGKNVVLREQVLASSATNVRDAPGRARRRRACMRSTTATPPPTSTTTPTSAAGKANIVMVTEP